MAPGYSASATNTRSAAGSGAARAAAALDHRLTDRPALIDSVLTTVFSFVHQSVALISRSIDLPWRVAVFAKLLTLDVAAFVAATARARATATGAAGSIDDRFANGAAFIDAVLTTVFGFVHDLVALLRSGIDLAWVMAVRTKSLALRIAARLMTVVIRMVVSAREGEADEG
jgi:hypothetical protein